MTILSFERLPRWFWPVLLGLNLLLHAPHFTLPPASIHVWRQAVTMAVARNFYEEDMNIMRPRVDRRNTTDGVTGMQFPSYEWAVARGYQLFGFSETMPRVFSWLLSVAGILAFYRLGRQVSGAAWPAAVGAWCLTWSPEIYFHSINALPDVLALSASIAGLLWFGQWRTTRRPVYLLLSLLAVTLAGLTKFQFLVVGFPIAVFVVRDAVQRRLGWPQAGLLAGYAAVAVGLPLAWYAYARELIASSGLLDFGIDVQTPPELAVGLRILRRNLLSDWPELLLGYGALGLLLAGLWRLGRNPPTRHPWFLPGLAWGAGLAAYYLIELKQMKGHTYYMLPLLPLLLLLAAWGAVALRRQPRLRPLLLALLLIQPVWAFARISWGRWINGSPDVPAELFNPAPRAALAAAIPPDALCLAGPDPSGCIYFYFLHKKGFGFVWADQLYTPVPGGDRYLDDCIARGAQYLYTSDRGVLQDVRLQPYLARQVKRVGDFEVWKLKAADPQP